jgi:shikimate dehydrogenase
MISSNLREGLSTPEINGQTQVLAVYGCPVEHSLSPAMHNAAIAILRLHYIYIPFSVQPSELRSAVQSIRSLCIRGVNLTVPHKESVLAYLDWISPEASAVGAVNTISNDNGRLLGYNTDGYGFIQPLIDDGINVRGKEVLVLGAGGAARSVVYRLAMDGAHIRIANRTAERARLLAESVNEFAGAERVRWIEYDDSAELANAAAGAELIVNATSMGMHPEVANMPPIPLRSFHPGQVVYDLIYNPAETLLLTEARIAGAETRNGLKMLAYQGAEAFRIWTGIKPPVEKMMEVLKRKLYL